MATHSSVLAWRIPGTEEPGGLPSMGSHRVGRDLAAAAATIFGFPGGTMVKNLPANARDFGSIPGSERSPGEGNGNPLLYSHLENSMDRPNWCATVYRVAKSAMTGQLIYTFPIVKSLSRVQLFATPWTVAYEAPLSMGFPRPEY